APLWIKRAKEPKLVLDDRTTDVATDVYFRKTIGRRSGKRKIIYFAHQTFGGAVAENIAVEFVAATLGDDVENAAGRLAVFGSVSAGLDFDLLHEFKRQVGARSAESGVSRVYAVEDVVVLWS